MARHRSWGRYASAFSSNTPWSSKARCRSFTAVTEVDLSYVPVVENGSLKEKWKQNKSVMKESYVSSVMKSLKLEFPLLEKLQLSLMAKRRVDVQCQMWHRHWKITQLWQKMRSLTYWPIRTSPQQKTRNLCLKQSAIHAILQKEGKCSSKFPPNKSKQVHFTPKLLDLERLFFARHKQEEQDRLLALQLQKEVNQEQMRPTWLKGSPDECQLRATSSPPGKLLNGQRKHAKERSFHRQTDLEHPAPHRASKSEHWQPSFRFQLEHCSVNARKYQVLL